MGDMLKEASHEDSKMDSTSSALSWPKVSAADWERFQETHEHYMDITRDDSMSLEFDYSFGADPEDDDDGAKNGTDSRSKAKKMENIKLEHSHTTIIGTKDGLNCEVEC